VTDADQWRGRVGEVWAEEWRRTDRSFAGLAPLLDAAILAVAPERSAALDVGCGAGTTGLALAAARPGLRVTGVDLSAELVAVAAERAAAVPNFDAEVADVSAPSASLVARRFDLAVSRHGVMFFADPVAGLSAIRRLLEPGARLVFSCFQSPARNAWATELGPAVAGTLPALSGHAPGPFAFADPDRVAALLDAAGWTHAEVHAAEWRYVAGEGADPVADALGFATRIGPAARALAEVPAGERDAAFARLRAALDRRRTGTTVDFPAAAWIWTARASGDPR